MNDNSIVCPHCKTKIALSESLAAPLLHQARLDYEAKLKEKNQFFAEQEKHLKQQNEQLQLQQQQLQIQQSNFEKQISEQVNARLSVSLKQERDKIAKETQQQVKESYASELQIKAQELEFLKSTLKAQETKIAESAHLQLSLLRERQALADAKRELELNVEKQIQSRTADLRQQVQRESDENYKLSLAEKEKIIADMQVKISDLKNKSEQTSNQLRGEVMELELESLLQEKFPWDNITPVAKGEAGADLVQRVLNQNGIDCGSILWEAKRTKNWNEAWLAKLRQDQRQIKADLAILVSYTLPKGLETFEYIEGIWVCHPKVVVPLASILRYSLQQISVARQMTIGQQSKTEMIYQYLTGPRFGQRVEAIVEAFSTMRDDLERERKAILKQWAKREEQIDRVMTATVSMYGDLQGIAGSSMQEIKGLEIQHLLAE